MNDTLHEDMYNSVRAEHPMLPAWKDLTEEQKVGIRDANESHMRFMNRLGAAIASGGPLPVMEWLRRKETTDEQA